MVLFSKKAMAMLWLVVMVWTTLSTALLQIPVIDSKEDSICGQSNILYINNRCCNAQIRDKIAFPPGVTTTEPTVIEGIRYTLNDRFRLMKK
jgi:hypothetical protein